MDNFDPPEANNINVGKINIQNKSAENNSNIDNEINEQEFYKNIQLPQSVIDAEQGVDDDNISTPSNDDSNQKVVPKKYNMFDLYWIYNTKLFDESGTKNILSDEEPDFIFITYNMNFGNLRVHFKKAPKEAFKNHIVFRNNMFHLIAGTIYPSSCYKIINSDDSSPIVCMEQLINETGEEWERNRPLTRITHSRETNELFMEIFDVENEKRYFYNFADWHYKLIIDSLSFVISDGFKLRGQKVLQEGV